MPSTKSRFRLFAGPNGSGKTSLFNYLREKGHIHTEIYVAADKIEKDFADSKEFNFNAYRVTVDDEEFKAHCRHSGLTKNEKFEAELIESLSIIAGVLKLKAEHTNKKYASYFGALIADYLVDRLFETGQSFCFETVFSHSGKIKKLKTAESFGYSTYLYYIFLTNSEMNVDRVADRVRQGGHPVPKEKILDRHPKSLKNLKPAALVADKTFLFDNTQNTELVCWIDRIVGELEVSANYPDWLRNYFDPEKTFR